MWVRFIFRLIALAVLILAILNLTGIVSIRKVPPTEKSTSCAVKEAIRAGAPLLRSYWKEQSNIDRLHNVIETTKQAKQTLHITDFQQTLEVVTMNRDKTQHLLVIAFQLATKNCTSEQQTQALSDFTREATGNDELSPLVQFAKTFVLEAQAYQQTGVIDERLLKVTLPENTQ
jgi:hypothetical protein